jgi:hypothetical protein
MTPPTNFTVPRQSLTEPEVYALNRIFWQFFVTLTFRSDQLRPSSRRALMFSWLRDVAGIVPRTHFRKLLWVSRFEHGRGLRGHFHLCIAGIDSRFITADLCARLELAWRIRAHARAEVLVYDHARDGVGYIMKIPSGGRGSASGLTDSSQHGDEEIIPTLSNSLYAAIRRGRM